MAAFNRITIKKVTLEVSGPTPKVAALAQRRRLAATIGGEAVWLHIRQVEIQHDTIRVHEDDPRPMHTGNSQARIELDVKQVDHARRR